MLFLFKQVTQALSEYLLNVISLQEGVFFVCFSGGEKFWQGMKVPDVDDVLRFILALNVPDML